MNCPFCAEEIKDEAIVCKHCRRDLSLVRPLLQALGAQTAQLSALNGAMQSLRDEIQVLATKAAASEVALAVAPADPPIVAAVIPAPDPAKQPVRLSSVLASLAAGFLALMVADYLLVWPFDLSMRWVFAATVAIPAAAALSSRDVARLPVVILVAVSAVLGIACVTAMIFVAVWGDVERVWPNGQREWIANIGWVLSVTLSFITGALTRRALSGGRGVLVRTAAISLLTAEGEQKAEARLMMVQRLIQVGTPVVTAFGSVAGVLMRSLLK